jgi:hypothetical protein
MLISSSSRVGKRFGSLSHKAGVFQRLRGRKFRAFGHGRFSFSSHSPTEKNGMLILTFLRAVRKIAVEAMTLRRVMRKRYRGSEE